MIQQFCVPVTFTYLTRALKNKSDAGNLDMPRGSYKILPLSENSQLIKERKNSYAEVTKIYSTIRYIERKRPCSLLFCFLALRTDSGPQVC
jgi:hypothetical protein